MLQHSFRGIAWRKDLNDFEKRILVSFPEHAAYLSSRQSPMLHRTVIHYNWLVDCFDILLKILVGIMFEFACLAMSKVSDDHRHNLCTVCRSTAEKPKLTSAEFGVSMADDKQTEGSSR